MRMSPLLAPARHSPCHVAVSATHPGCREVERPGPSAAPGVCLNRHQLSDPVGGVLGGWLVAGVHADGGLRAGHAAQDGRVCLNRHQLPDPVGGVPGGGLVAGVHADGGLRAGHAAQDEQMALPLRGGVPGPGRGARQPAPVLPAALSLVQGGYSSLSQWVSKCASNIILVRPVTTGHTVLLPLIFLQSSSALSMLVLPPVSHKRLRG